MLLHGKADSSSVNGPGERCVIWFQGCNLGCSGCWNPDTHAFDKAKSIDRQEVINWIASLPSTLEGITFSGGDPVQHILDTSAIARWIRTNRPSWSVGMFTGYTYKEVASGKYKYYREDASIKANYPYMDGEAELWYNLEGLLDYAVMGRYNKLLQINDPNVPLVTTSNQELRLFSHRYKESDFNSQAVEISIDEDGNLMLSGFPVNADLEELRA